MAAGTRSEGKSPAPQLEAVRLQKRSLQLDRITNEFTNIEKGRYLGPCFFHLYLLWCSYRHNLTCQTYRLWGCRNWQPLFAGRNLAPPVESAINVTSQLGDSNLHTLKYLVNKRLGNDHGIQVARVPTPCSPIPRRYPMGLPIPFGDRC
jgi:hypothetical protein